MGRKKKKQMMKARANKPTPEVASPSVKLVRAERFNSGRIENDSKSHWRFADNKSIDCALNPQVRRRIRDRARYEIANNSYAYGAAMSIANAVIGDGPKIHVSFTDVSSMASKKAAKLATKVEGDFARWARNICLAEKLRAMRFAKFQDGESFALFYNNPRSKDPVQLDLMPFDCERVQSEYTLSYDRQVDGIWLDEWGNPVQYRVLENHPGGQAWSMVTYPQWAVMYNADRVVHWYRKNTPEQHRGVSEISPGLDILQYLGRYSRAVVTAAEVAADLALVFYTDETEDVGGYDVSEFNSDSIRYMQNTPDVPFGEVPFSRGTTMTAPTGCKVSQLKPEQPTSNYAMLVDELLGEFGSAIGVPRLVLKKSAAGYNYASGRLDLQDYYRFIKLNQVSCEDKVLIPLFNAWFKEWALVNNYKGEAPLIDFFWIGFEHVDPLKEASAQGLRLASRTTNLAIEYGRQGRDWEDELEQLARERAKISELENTYGVSLSDVAGSVKNGGQEVSDE